MSTTLLTKVSNNPPLCLCQGTRSCATKKQSLQNHKGDYGLIQFYLHPWLSPLSTPPKRCCDWVSEAVNLIEFLKPAISWSRLAEHQAVTMFRGNKTNTFWSLQTQRGIAVLWGTLLLVGSRWPKPLCCTPQTRFSQGSTCSPHCFQAAERRFWSWF